MCPGAAATTSEASRAYDDVFELCGATDGSIVVRADAPISDVTIAAFMGVVWVVTGDYCNLYFTLNYNL